MKHIKVVELRNSLLRIKSVKGKKLNYSILMNIQRANEALTPLEVMEKELNAGVEAYNKEYVALCEKNSKVDGVVKFKNEDHYDIIDLPAHLEEVKALDEKHKDAVDAFKIERKKHDDFVNNEDSEFVMISVKMDDLPEDIDTEDMDCLFPMIVE